MNKRSPSYWPALGAGVPFLALGLWALSDAAKKGHTVGIIFSVLVLLLAVALMTLLGASAHRRRKSG